MTRAEASVRGCASLLLAVSCARGSIDGYHARLLEPAAASEPGVRVTWMGTAGVLVDDGETAFYIDPFVSRGRGPWALLFGAKLHPDRELVARWVERTAHGRVAGVLVSHSHFDHAMDAPFFAARCGARLIGSESTTWIGRGAGLPAAAQQTVEHGDVVRLGAFRIRFLEGKHGSNPFGGEIERRDIVGPVVPPATHYDYRLGAVFSLVIEHPRGTMVHHASAGVRPGMFAGVDADVVLLGIAGRERTERYLDEVVDALAAEQVVPIHFDDFFVPLDRPMRPLVTVDLDEFWQAVDAHRPRVRVGTLPIGEPVVLLDGGATG